MALRSFNNPQARFLDFFSKTGTDASGEFLVSFSATGGNVVPSAVTGNGYTYHVFTASGEFTVYGYNTKNIEYLVIAGGGSGGFSGASGGGGGAGGFKTNVPGHPYSGASLPLGSGSYPVSIGAGGAGQSPGSSWPSTSILGSNGTNTTFHTITSTGGGGGGAEGGAAPNVGSSGGSGGGAGSNGGSSSSGGSASPPGQGNSGGNSSGTHQCYASGGGGGAGGGGSTSSPGTPAPGGTGSPIPAFAYPIIQPGIPAPMQPTFGSVVGPTGLYAAGGGGGVYNWDNRSPATNCFPLGGGKGGGPSGPTGGAGNGGAGSNFTPNPQGTTLATSAVSGTGSGGGGSGGGGNGIPWNSGSGGDGIVIIRYLAS